MKELNLFCFIVNISVTVFCGLILPLIPALTRKSFLFGVEIPAEEQNCPEARRLKKRYAAVCASGAAAVLGLAVAQFATAPDMTLLACAYFPILFVPVQLAAFVPAWKAALRLKRERKWQAPGAVFAETGSSFSRGNLSAMPWGWYIAGLVIIVVSVMIALSEYPAIPDRIATHFDINMIPDAWANKSILSVLFLPILNLFILAGMWSAGVSVVKGKLQIDRQNPALSFAQHSVYRRRMGHGIGLMALAIAASFSLYGFAQMWRDFRFPFWLTLVLQLAPMVPLVVTSVRSGQGGCKIKPKLADMGSSGEKRRSAGPGNTAGRGDDKYWALGLFYHNPGDPARIVEDRFGNGLGFNYSRASVKIGAAVCALITAAMYAWLTVWLVRG
jgi:uncharacterized membrane protein